MKENIRKIIEKLVMKKYPEIVSVDEIIDLSEEYDLESYQHNYHVNLTTSECLKMRQMMNIDTEIKNLFSMLGLEQSNPFNVRKPHIKTFFDCGDGEGYTFTGGWAYNH